MQWLDRTDSNTEHDIEFRPHPPHQFSGLIDQLYSMFISKFIAFTRYVNNNLISHDISYNTLEIIFDQFSKFSVSILYTYAGSYCIGHMIFFQLITKNNCKHIAISVFFNTKQLHIILYILFKVFRKK